MIAIGSSFYPAQGTAERRQVRARQALLALPDVVAINLQFHDERYEFEGFRTVSVLQLDSRGVTGADGPRKPIVPEMFDALAAAARDAGARYFAYINADIEVTPAAIDYIQSRARDAYAFCRVDVDPDTRSGLGIQPYGADMFAIDRAWWSRERRRFRPYVAGEACWDNVYAALICYHGRGDIVNHRELIFHERHPAVWKDSPNAAYNGYLAALDAPYFSRWVQYVEAVKRANAGDDEAHDRLIREMFTDAPIALAERIRHAGRQLRARWRYARWGGQ